MVFLNPQQKYLKFLEKATGVWWGIIQALLCVFRDERLCKFEFIFLSINAVRD